MALDKGFLYVAIGRKYALEAEQSARSLKRFSALPVCLLTDDKEYHSSYFDIITHLQSDLSYGSKIEGLLNSPFNKTVFLDCDTFVCYNIDNIFDVLEIFDFAMTSDVNIHTFGFSANTLLLEGIIPEYNTGIIVFRKNIVTQMFLSKWLNIHLLKQYKADMPSFREAYLQNIDLVRIATLPREYNFYGSATFNIAYTSVKVIHDRLGHRWNTLTKVILPFEKMEKFQKRLNNYTGKRIIISKNIIVPYYYSPSSIKRKIKSLFGVKRTKKNRTY